MPDELSTKELAPGEPAFLARPATPADVPAIISIERAALSAAHWQENSYREVFAPESPARIAILLEDERHSPCGFVIARLTSGECELENIALLPSLQRKGAGTQLIQSLISAARERGAHSIYLEVRESNRVARAFYERCGFAKIGRRPQYYSDPQDDAVLYSLHLQRFL